MSAIPYMPLWCADYLADTAHLTTEEHGAYMLLIMTYWQRGKALPGDPARLANIARLSNERWASVERTLSEFFTVVQADGGTEWQHDRIETELARSRDKIEKARAAGKAGGRTRKTAKTDDPETPAKQTPNGRLADAQQTPKRTPNYTESESEIDKDITQPSRESLAAAREAEGWQELKGAFNGSTEAMIADVTKWMGPTARRGNAVNWLTGTLSAYGHERTARAWTIVTAKMASGEIVGNPLALLSRTAQGLKASTASNGEKTKTKSLTARAAERAAAVAGG